MYWNVPGDMNVTRNRVTPAGDCASPVRSSGAARSCPECTLSPGEVITACRAPSESTVTLGDGGALTGSRGSIPKVTVWLTVGPTFVHSTVSPTWTIVTSRRKRMTADV